MNNEKYKINGIVKIYDENHNLLQETHNMIVEEGRKKIMNVLLGGGKAPTLEYFYETGTESKITTPKMEFDTTNSKIVPSSSIKSEIKENEICTVYTATIVWNNEDPQYTPINAVGLCWKDEDTKAQDTKTHLFSRAAIDNVYMHKGRTYIIEHTVYF